MKKFILPGFFILLIVATVLATKITALAKSGGTEVKYRKHEVELSDTEISDRGIKPVSGKNVEEHWETKETRIRNGLFGWETKIETTVPKQTFYVDCGCRQ